MRIGDEQKFLMEGDRVLIPKGEIHQILPNEHTGQLEMHVLTDPAFDPNAVVEMPDFYEYKNRASPPR